MSESDSLNDIVSNFNGADEKKYSLDPECYLGLPRGKIAIHIASAGQWLYRGEPFERKSMVQLLARSLVFDAGEHYLVAPEQLLKISVEDCPFLIVDATPVSGSAESPPASAGDKLVMTTNMEERFVLGEQGHTLKLQALPGSEQLSPVVEVRNQLFARLSRNVYYQLIEFAHTVEQLQQDGSTRTVMQIESAGKQFVLGSIEDD